MAQKVNVQYVENMLSKMELYSEKNLSCALNAKSFRRQQLLLKQRAKGKLLTNI